ncbi:hypothetical protein [Thermoactinomyces mirandus]|uniref:hypothetical protein n=1 Tax=Thermoactinomyces mirandus TaxID=2756294 RepID=UPI001C68A7A5|nr:hypothetical protein [Thermoactinomyces mirandus]
MREPKNSINLLFAYITSMGLISVITYDESKDRKDKIKYPLNSNKILYLLDSLQYDAEKQTLDEI